MDNISFKRFLKYWIEVSLRTAKDLFGYILKLWTDFAGVFLPIAVYFVLVYLGSVGLLRVDQIEQVTSPFGDFAQAIIIIVILVLTYILGCLFVTPARLYYEKKKIADQGNWNDVEFKIVRPERINLLGWGIKIVNNKLTPIENLSLWIVGATPDSDIQISKPKRFGYVNNYETDKEVIFSSADLPVGEEKVFIIANYDYLAQTFRIIAREAYEENPSNGIEIPKPSSRVLDIEYRASGMPKTVVRYGIDITEEMSFFSRYKAKARTLRE